MTRYHLPSLLARGDENLKHRMIELGTLVEGNMYIDLPDNFDWRGAPVPQAIWPPPASSKNPQSEIENHKLTGLGDAFALVAKPIARAIDRITGTKLEGCQSCARRQARLNALVPFGDQAKS